MTIPYSNKSDRPLSQPFNKIPEQISLALPLPLQLLLVLSRLVLLNLLLVPRPPCPHVDTPISVARIQFQPGAARRMDPPCHGVDAACARQLAHSPTATRGEGGLSLDGRPRRTGRPQRGEHVSFAETEDEDLAFAAVVGPEEQLLARSAAAAGGRDQRAELPVALVPDPRPEMHQLVPPRRRVPHPDPLVLARRHERLAAVAAAAGPPHTRHRPVVRGRVPVQRGAARVFRCVVRGQDSDCVVEVQRGERTLGAADVEEQDPSVGGA